MPHPTVLTAWTGALLRCLDAQAIDGWSLAREAGIAADVLDDPDRRAPLSATTRLWRLAVEATGDPALGVQVARHVRPTTFHALGPAVLSSATLWDALERIARYSAVTSDVAVVSALRARDHVELRIGWRPGEERPAPEAVDAIVATIVRGARALLDRSVAPERIELERALVAPRSGFDRCFRCPIRFGAGRNVVVFGRADAERPVVAANAALARLTDEVVAAYLTRTAAPTVAGRAREAILDLLPSGAPTVAVVAGRLHLSPRSLQRALASEDTSYRRVLDEARLELAFEYLRDGNRSVTEVAFLLGFAETAAFSRAFRRWTGQPPSVARGDPAWPPMGSPIRPR